MEESLSFICGGCCAAIAAQIQYAFCNTRQYGADATCCDNCCRFNCCWKQGALPVEDYPIGSSAPEDRTQSVDPVKTDGEAAPAYEATPQMSAAPPAAATEAAPAAAGAGAEAADVKAGGDQTRS